MGAKAHKFALNSHLAEAGVAAFENLQTISLSGNYRHFITQISKGCAGPPYGIFPLGRMDSLRTGHGPEQIDPLPIQKLLRIDTPVTNPDMMWGIL